MKNIADIAINSMNNTLTTARSYMNTELDGESVRSVLLAKLNEASGKCMIVCEILIELDRLDEEAKVLNHFNEKIAPEFAKMISKTWH